MIIPLDRIPRVLAGEITQLHVLWKPDWRFVPMSLVASVTIENTVTGRTAYHVGQLEAVQPGRGKPGLWIKGDEVIRDPCGHVLRAGGMGGVLPQAQRWLKAEGYTPLRIRILALERGDVRNISIEDVKAEGYETTFDYLKVWCELHDKMTLTVGSAGYHQRQVSIDNVIEGMIAAGEPLLALAYRQEWLAALATRPAARYDALAITFEAAR